MKFKDVKVHVPRKNLENSTLQCRFGRSIYASPCHLRLPKSYYKLVFCNVTLCFYNYFSQVTNIIVFKLHFA